MELMIASILGVAAGFIAARLVLLNNLYRLQDLVNRALSDLSRDQAEVNRLLRQITSWGESNIPVFTTILGQTERTADACRGEAAECSKLLREVNETVKRWVKP